MTQLNRRVLIQAAAGTAITPWALAEGRASKPASASAASAGTDGKAKPLSPSGWMDKWIKKWKEDGKDVEGLLYLGRFADPIYFLTKEVSWKPNASQSGDLPKVTVPIGFVTDFASIPRPFWSLLRPDGNYAYAAVVHDYLYWTQSLSRDQSDLIFKLAMQDFEIDALTVSAIFEAVHRGGASAWRQNAALKKGGEKRLIKPDAFPKDPRVKWKDFKKKIDAFQV